MYGSITYRRRTLRALVGIFAVVLCAACHQSPRQANVPPKLGADPEMPGAQAPTPPARPIDSVPQAIDELNASCGGPKSFHIVARAANVSDPEHQGFTSDGAIRWRFRPEETAGRTVVAACIEPLPQGCVQTRLAELVDARWVEATVSTTGLPRLAVVNLLTAPGTPFRHAFHEAGPPFEGDRQEICDYYNMMEGTVGLEGLYGAWPDNAWAKVTFAEDHSGIPYDQLYRWDGKRWKLHYAPKRFGTYVEAAVPWLGGLAVVAVENAEVEPRWKLVHLGDRDRVLIPRRTGEARVGRVGDALVLASIERDDADVESIRISRWASPRSAPKAQALDVPQGDQILWVTVGEDAVTVHLVRDGGARVDDVWRFDGRWALKERRELAEGDESGDADEGGDPIECRDLALGGTAIDIRSEWRQGDRLWLEVDAPGGGGTWLLSDRPVDDVWEIPDEPLIWPPRPQCPPGKIPEGFGEGHGEWLGDW